VKSLLLHICPDESHEACLEAAVDIARAFGGHVDCLETPQHDHREPSGAERQRQPIRARVEKRLGAEDIACTWHASRLPAAQAITARAGLADIVVLGPSAHGRDSVDGPLPLAAGVSLYARTLTLVVPPGTHPGGGGAAAVIAWNGSAEAAQALRLSLPLLRRAACLHVVTVSGDPIAIPAFEASAYLGRHGLEAELHQWPRRNRVIGSALLSAAVELDASFIVMGAHGHLRGRDQILGEVTADMLDHSPVALLLAR
jgi:nucleotide-binding universal stress UspA family protein